jgi:two-component system, LytTR family, sensor kinase
MKVRWREHEIIFVSMISAIILAAYLLNMHQASPAQFAGPFINNHVPFNFYRNVLLPDIGTGVLVYLSYLWVSLYTIPRFLFPKKFEVGISKISVSFKKISLHGLARKILKNYAWLFIQIVIITILLGTAINIVTYYRHQWLFNYPGFSFFPKKGYNPHAQINIGEGYAIVLFMMALYAVYVSARELIIHFIEIPGSRRTFRVSICNQVSLFLVIYLSVALFIIAFGFVNIVSFSIVYFCWIPPVLLVFLSNIYWLFPLKGDHSIFSFRVIKRLLTSTFLYTIPFIIFIGEPPFVIRALLVCLAIQLLIVTPISWLVYQQRKDKILQLRGVEKALVKSKADLQFLRSQINPHFLFNVLNTLYGTALHENAERTAGGIQKLGDMMRFMLHENNLDSIQMSREIDYLKNYIALQKLRTQSSSEIIIEDNISGQNCNHKIAPMLLIPLVENAFKHGISLKEKSWIKINLECNETNILFEVHNSMHLRQDNDPEKERSGIGFKNVLERLKLIYPGKHEISVNGDGKEFFVQLAIQP